MRRFFFVLDTWAELGPLLPGLLAYLKEHTARLEKQAELLLEGGRQRKVPLDALVETVQGESFGKADLGFHFSAASPGSFGFDWTVVPQRFRERPFDDVSAVVSDTGDDPAVAAALPRFLSGLCEITSAVYGRAEESLSFANEHPYMNPAASRYKRTETLLHVLPPLAPVTWLCSSLVKYLGGVRKIRSSGLTVEQGRGGALLTVPGGLLASPDECIAIQEKLSADHFFHGKDWDSYPPFPLADLVRDLPSRPARRPS